MLVPCGPIGPPAPVNSGVRLFENTRLCDLLDLINMATSRYFPKSFLLLQQEGHLIHTCLATGLTQLRNAHVHNKGEFYSALFNLSIGTERLLKAIVIMHHMLKNGLAVPTKRQLKEYGHDLTTLYTTCVEISDGEESVVSAISRIDSITQEILKLLSEFAQTTRYHNLDALSAAAPGKDPLVHINEILGMVLASDVPPSTIKRLTESRAGVASAISDISTILAQGLDGSDLTLEEAFVLPALHERAVRFVVLRIVQLLAPLKELIGDLSRKAYGLGVPQPPFPQMHEFVEFLWEDRGYVLGKKRWP